MPKGNKQATGRKTSEPLITMRFGSPSKQVKELGYKEAQKIARLAANNAILTAFRAKINKDEDNHLHAATAWPQPKNAQAIHQPVPILEA